MKNRSQGVVNRETLKSRARGAILGVLLPHLPPVPSMNKWTKFGPCNDFWCAGVLFDIFKFLCQIAFETLEIELSKKVDIIEAKNASKDAGEPDPEVAVQVSWHKVAGSRFARLHGTLQDKLTSFMKATCRGVTWEGVGAFRRFKTKLLCFERSPPRCSKLFWYMCGSGVTLGDSWA